MHQIESNKSSKSYFRASIYSFLDLRGEIFHGQLKSSCLELEDTSIRTAFARSLSETFVVTSTPKKRKRDDK